MTQEKKRHPLSAQGNPSAWDQRASRRSFLKAAGSAGAAGAVVLGAPLIGAGTAEGALQNQRPYLFTICAAGGASIIDSFLAQPRGPGSYPNLVRPAGSMLSAAPVLNNSIQGQITLGNGYAQSTFLTKHGADTVVMTCEVSSVNHQVAARRAITGDNVNGGRTIQEAVSLKYGQSLPIANLMLAGGGYASRGDDITIPEWARGQVIVDPLMFAFATHGSKAINQNLSGDEIAQIRKLRKQLESQSVAVNQLQNGKVFDNYIANRDRVTEMLEKGDAITKLMMLDPATNNLQSFGLQTSPDLTLLQSKFPRLASDPYESRMALAFLAVKNQISTAVTVSPPMAPLLTAQSSPNTPIAFDWSHVDHRGAQNTMWSYILKSVDGLIDLLKATPDPLEPQKKCGTNPSSISQPNLDGIKSQRAEVDTISTTVW